MLVATAVTAITAAIVTHKISTSLYAAKETVSASKSQIASKLAANSLVPAEIAPSISPCLEYRVISPTLSEYKSIKSQSYLTIEELYTRYAPLRCMRSSHLTVQNLYMKYVLLNTVKSLLSTRSTSSISTRSARLILRILLIMIIKNLYKRFEKFAEKIVPDTSKCIQHSLDSQNKSTVSLLVSLSVN